MPVIKFYPFSQDTINLGVEPTPAIKHTPSWYKRQPSYSGDEDSFLKHGFSSSTIKRCMPLFDGMSAGYILYVPSDIYVDTTMDDEKIQWSVPETVKFMRKDLISTHGHEQVSDYPIDKEKYHKQVFRIMPFWAVGTDDGYSCLFTQPMHQDPVPFKIFSAIIDTDKFLSDGHLSMLIEKGFKGIIPKGTPLAQVIPFKRESYSMEIVDLQASAKKLSEQRISVRSTFKNFYRTKLRSKKEYK